MEIEENKTKKYTPESVWEFIQTVNTGNLAKGIYFLKILIDGKYTVERVVVE